MGSFDDLLAANEEFSATFTDAALTGRAARGLAVVTCMDSRIDPLGVFGLKAGDAKILRNAGARVTDDVLRTLVLAVYLLDVKRVLVMPHTDCGMSKATDDDVHGLAAQHGVDTRSLEFHTVPDQRAALRHDLTRIRTSPFLPPDLPVGGAIYDVRTGRIMPIDIRRPTDDRSPAEH
ncbi:carbonic anhydrase [Streptosporangium sp. NBC_01639]|uniref:beta-class carbonic anhydrase n=1 Tax=unclassified Streptosporangium TaxID=2632669 RepID=UPI002DDA9293|nr:carbonic anhydrase [Streptosporangium sp. NBC_01756]WSC88035.1 carbonic anhydrase [Streptosporangium sp. NBC_01756]WTD53286.1 carbonic anhydrase [Streptosporangium sp. NBC_01639]